MDKEQVKQIMDNCRLPDSCNNKELKETHISWVILSDNYAFKIKRPVKYSFLDFSKLEKRKFYCYEELKLNRRLEPEMYLEVLPVTKNGIESNEGTSIEEISDYTVKMQRMDNSKEMDVMLREDKVSEPHIIKLAEKIAQFHKKAKVIKNAFRTLKFQEEYADIQNHKEFISEMLGEGQKQIIEDCIEKSFNYLNAIRSFSNERVISGYHRDCHGDLNSHNIFLYDDEPVVFDCIEFNSELRQIDVLNDIAFLCVDLDFYGKEDLSELFYKRYLEFSKLNEEPGISELFHYYKSYRANIRAKVTLISAKKQKGKKNIKELNDAKKYIRLMSNYMNLKLNKY